MPKIPGRSAIDYLPDGLNYTELKAAAESCRGCDLYKTATQTVFGEGATNADIMFVGEQPGDEEDLSGHPFVGPAGKLFDRALAEAGIDRADAYVTNVVKHFKWKQRGKRRLHERPRAGEINACMPWLESELTVIRPRILVCLGATAAQALLGRAFRVTQDRGRWVDSELADKVMATVHPSSILRAPDDSRREQYRDFISDLTVAAKELHKKARGASK